jgi:hypothetical protein
MQLAPFVAILSILGGLWPMGPHTSDRVRRIETWRLVVHQERFSGETICVLRTHDAYFERGVVMFKLPARENVADALFRIDGGAARSIRDNDLDIAKAGLPVYQDGKDPRDPGLARVPAPLLQGARVVQFQVRLGGRAYRFDVRGLDAALAVAMASGCQPAAFRQSLS